MRALFILCDSIVLWAVSQWLPLIPGVDQVFATMAGIAAVGMFAYSFWLFLHLAQAVSELEADEAEQAEAEQAAANQ